jgi:hypothetical protein
MRQFIPEDESITGWLVGRFGENIRDGFDLDSIKATSGKGKQEIMTILQDVGAAIDGDNP